jgi:hypothetical protein
MPTSRSKAVAARAAKRKQPTPVTKAGGTGVSRTPNARPTPATPKLTTPVTSTTGVTAVQTPTRDIDFTGGREQASVAPPVGISDAALLGLSERRQAGTLTGEQGSLLNRELARRQVSGGRDPSGNLPSTESIISGLRGGDTGRRGAGLTQEAQASRQAIQDKGAQRRERAATPQQMASDAITSENESRAKAGIGPMSPEEAARTEAAFLQREVANQQLQDIETQRKESAGVSGVQAGEGAPTGEGGAQEPSATDIPGFSSDINQFMPEMDFFARSKMAAGENLDDVLSEVNQQEALSDQLFNIGSNNAVIRREGQLDLADKIDNLDRARTEETNRKNLAESINSQELFNIENARAENIARDQAVEAEMESRRIAAKLGINHDTGGLQWMRDNIRKADDTLAFIVQKSAFGNKEFSNERISLANKFSNDMKSIDLNLQQNYEKAWFEFDQSMKSITNQRVLSSREASKEKRTARQSYMDRLFEIDKIKADQQFTAIENARENEAAMRKEEMDSIIKTGDSLKFVQDLRKEITGNSFISEGRAVDTRFRSIEAALKSIEVAEESGDTTQKNFADQAMINLFNKITDPTSVVRESEFARSAAGLSLMQRFEATFRKVQEGGVLEPDARRELRDAAKVIADEYKKQLTRDLQPFIMDVQIFNSQANVATPVKLNQILPSNLIPILPSSKMDMWREQASGNDVSLGSDSPAPSFRTDSPPEGFRTDRHNNPTALAWSSRLEKWFQDRGHNVTKGDVFPKNPSQFTMDMNNVADPISATIEYIDAHTFFFNGDQRWTHTAMNKNDWDSLSFSQKSSVVDDMYRKEAGSGVLASSAPAEEDLFVASTNFSREVQQAANDVKQGRKTVEQIVNDPRFSPEDIQAFSQMAGLQARELTRDVSKLGGQFIGQFPGRLNEAFSGTAEDVGKQFANIGGSVTRNVINPFFKGLTQ